ncbi:hypothetical protein [Peribacillus sp. NPDC096540]|uniref:hypothetical protein n=1 Tax=Peribacillus sp. NPDC096540 TaxID=3390612 RepID=UPI003D049FB4
MGVQTSVVIIPNRDLRERYNREINSMAIGWATPFGIAALESGYPIRGRMAEFPGTWI